MLEYLTVLSRPLALSDVSHPVYTPLYLDSEGLGMMTTVSIGIFDKKENTSEKLLGVAGIDVVIDELNNQINKAYLGVSGYGYVISNYGVVLIHPHLRDQRGKLPEPPTTFLEHLEYSVDPSGAMNLKRSMINREFGNITINVYRFQFQDQGRRLKKVSLTYFFTPVNNTQFSAGVSLENGKSKLMKVKSNLVRAILSNALECLNKTCVNCRIFLTDWEFCKPDNTSDHKTRTLTSLYEKLRDSWTSNKDDLIPKDCDKTLVGNLLLSANVINETSTTIWNDRFMHANNITYILAATTAGFLKLQFRSDCPNNLSSSIKSTEIFDQRYFQHSINYAYEDKELLVFTVEDKGSDYTTFKMETSEAYKSADITVSTALRLSNTTHITSVVGFLIDSERIKHVLSEAVGNDTFSSDKLPGKKEQYFLLDENGFIVVDDTSHKREGEFIGVVMGYLFEHLLDQNIFSKKMFNDSQASCFPKYYNKTLTQSSATALITPLRVIAKSSVLLFHFLVSFMYSVAYTLIALPFEMFSSVGEIKVVSCTKSFPIYEYNGNSTNGTLICNKTSIPYAITKVDGTNLVLLVTYDLPNECPKISIMTDPVKLGDATICNEPKHYSRPWQKTFTRHVNESDDCLKVSSVAHFSSSRCITSIIVFLIIFYITML